MGILAQSHYSKGTKAMLMKAVLLAFLLTLNKYLSAKSQVFRKKSCCEIFHSSQEDISAGDSF